jgi:hypothetical protein
MRFLLTTLLIGGVLLANTASAQNNTQIAGSYSLSAVYDQTQDGQKHNPWGEGVKGSLILTPTGQFSVMIVSDNRDKAASKSPRTPVGPVVAYYGTYTVGGDGKSLVYHVDRSSFPAWDKHRSPCRHRLGIRRPAGTRCDGDRRCRARRFQVASDVDANEVT